MYVRPHAMQVVSPGGSPTPHMLTDTQGATFHKAQPKDKLTLSLGLSDDAFWCVLTWPSCVSAGCTYCSCARPEPELNIVANNEQVYVAALWLAIGTLNERP